MQDNEAVIRCVVVDDHEVLRMGLVRALSAADGIEVVGEAGDGLAAVALAERRCPDVVILDLGLPGLDGLEACRRIRAAGEARVIAFTGECDPATLDSALDAGAAGFVVKTSPMAELVRAVRVVARNETFVEATLVTALLDRRAAPERSLLSGREAEVLQHLADGLTTDAAASALFLSPATVRSYAETAMQKVGGRNRTHAVAAALRAGLID